LKDRKMTDRKIKRWQMHDWKITETETNPGVPEFGVHNVV